MRSIIPRLTATSLATLSALLYMTSSIAGAAPEAALPVIMHELLAPPAVPPQITRKTPARVVVNLTVESNGRSRPVPVTRSGRSAARCRAR